MTENANKFQTIVSGKKAINFNFVMCKISNVFFLWSEEAGREGNSLALLAGFIYNSMKQ